MDVREYHRMWRVIDMSVTAHSILRDRFRRRERGITLLVIGLSIAATALAFVESRNAVHIAGYLTGVIFFLALLDLTSDWSGRARVHGTAAHALSDLKATFRAVTVTDEQVDAEGVDLAVAYETAMAAVPPIPDREFPALKAKHSRKVALSRLVDEHPGAPVLYLRSIVLWRGFKGKRPREKADSTEPVERPPV